MRLDRMARYPRQAAIRLMTYPFLFVPECGFKRMVRSIILSVQNSLPFEIAINRGDTAVAVGIPWPRTMRRIMRAVGPEGRVVVIEAEKSNYERLRSHVQSAESNIHIVHIGAWSSKKTVRFAISPRDEDHKIPHDDIAMDNDLRPENRDMEMVEIPVDTVDNILTDLGIDTVNYLCVTVNGAELEVLKGARGVLTRSTGVRVNAKGHAHLEDGRPINVLTRKFMADLGYRTKITRGEPSSAPGDEWPMREGDLFAWR